MRTKFSVAAFVSVTVLMPAVFVSTSYAATGINLISQTHHVWGRITEHGTVTDSYDITDITPVSDNCSIVYYAEQNSSTGDFTVDTKSDADMGLGYQAWGGAQIDYMFRPQTNSLQIALSGYSGIYWFTGGSVFMLKDLDTSVILDSRSWEYEYTQTPGVLGRWQDDVLPYYGSYAVIPDHTYSMTIGAYSYQPDSWYGSAHLEAVVTPEPATLLLLGLGAATLIRKR